MTTRELEQELITVKRTLQQLQIAVERMSALLPQTALSETTTSRKWLTLIGVGKEVWQNVDADKYINTERDSWN
jgi:hypothetical protein